MARFVHIGFLLNPKADNDDNEQEEKQVAPEVVNGEVLADKKKDS